MRITIFGTGYVGLVTGACLAEVGHHVMCMDVDQAKIDRLREGIIPIYEPGLEPIVAHNTAAGRLQFTTDVVEAVDYGELQFIAVGTPSDEDGSADLKYVLAVAGSIGEHMNDYKVVIDKSTVPVGTADKVREAVRGKLLERSADIDFDVISNPEFLKEGAAVDDFMKPDRIIVGTDSDRPQELLRELYYPFNRNHERVIFMDVRSAELTKYAANAMLATKISFMNEVANLAERLGADIEHVRRGMGSDPRIGYHFIYPGCGYGGSCFPKDVKALAWTAREYDYEARLLDAVEAVNSAQKHVLFDKVSHYYGGDLAGKTVALWGLSFKPKTDDMREAPSRVLMEKLWAAGASVQAFDPEAMEETQRIYPDQPGLQLCGTKEQALKGADCLVICTEWKEFRSPDFAQIAAAIRSPVVFDGRNLYDEKMLGRHGLSYYAIGRGLNQFGTR
ncbi:UDP-glucose/GDP-mannose dehydrogenase family protein [uncultured Halovibrio sp.]|uniref:UDP-glucose dehydrogenase family protein n=1 Tax=uncultured Halovibrio sp. TaxID=985049 RepID=UPI0025D86F09|nr:UDP-glucose/GDP-mannose dehydrogenase family protein [uncultured Halovibrio sp.]